MRLSREDGRQAVGPAGFPSIPSSAQKQLQQQHPFILCLSFSPSWLALNVKDCFLVAFPLLGIAYLAKQPPELIAGLGTNAM